jgi:beta-glucosidase
VTSNEFATLYGQPLPSPYLVFDKPKRITCGLTTAVSDLKYANGWVGRFFAFALRLAYKLLNAFGHKDTANMIMLGVYHMPLRGISRMTGGALTYLQLEGLITMFNGHFWKGLHMFIVASQNRKKESKLLKKAENKN